MSELRLCYCLDMFRAKATALVLLISLGACAAPPVPSAGDATIEESLVVEVTAPDDSIDCRYEKQTGSHMVVRVCTTAAERREVEAAAQQWLRTGGRSGSVERVRDAADPRKQTDP